MLLTVMLMVDIGIVRMRVRQGVVMMPMRVSHARRDMHIMLVPMMFVMLVFVVVFKWFVYVRVLMPLADVQVYA